ncbi:MAG: tetratricopeptide repeat protein [Proteobacteria bacterium]|nr:tetratricopeptide repeat protein [Pseudomonadota bacterium]MBU1452604.1 tetratricopeptide repeat protein [Pseudomonadota bacterium]MBU2467915.1 tetratricopeptide repeat protein [Pseudomonadota bacterium]MBU2519329.1 tetratricopeptide repeat protein [Pseudomonadota bacterium]
MRRESLKCCALLAILLLWAGPALAGNISLRVAVTPILQHGRLAVKVEMRNKGQEAAHGLEIAIQAHGASAQASGPATLAPGKSATVVLSTSFAPPLPGTYGVLVRVNYTDSNGYPLSAISWGIFSHQKAAASRLSIKGQAGGPLPAKPPAFVLHNPGPGARRVSLAVMAPGEMTPRLTRQEVLLGPGQSRRVEAALSNRGALDDSLYPVVALAGYQEDGRQHTVAAVALLKVSTPPDTLAAWRAWLWALAGLLAAIMAVLWLRGRGGPAPAGAPGWAFWLELSLALVCAAYTLSYLAPGLLIKEGITTGGDTASHYYSAWYLKHVLLPSGRIAGWCPGNLAGYPMFQFYFPLPFLVMVLLSAAVPLGVAFKLVTAGGAVVLPLAVWLGLRLARAPFPAPSLGAVLSLLFLFNQTNSTFGGNLPSLLAGEFTYSYSLALMVVFFGALAGDLGERRHPLRAAVLLAATGLCHGGPLLFGVLAGGCFLFSRQAAARALYLGKVYALAFAFLGFWIVPLLALASYNSPHNMVWIISAWDTALPPLLLPLMGLALLHFAWRLARRLRGRGDLGPAAFFGGQVVLASLLYLVAFHINVIDIRFLPFAWLALTLWAAWALAEWLRRMPAAWLAPALALVLVLLGVGYNVSFIPRWAAWNYSGFAAAPGWEDFRRLNGYLKGGPGDPRVSYEHSILHRRAGSVRALESLPLFSGRSTLEGLYIQSSPSSPFIFYLQSLTCQRPSTPITGYNYAGMELSKGLERLRLFNVSQFVATSPEVKRAARAHPGFTPKASFGPYTVFGLAGSGGYVTPLRYKPVLVTGKPWKYAAFDWFRGEELEVPLVFAGAAEAGDLERFASAGPAPPEKLPRLPLPPARVSSRVGWQEINITTDRLTPLLIKMSYHPNWKVEGAAKVFLASPSFMLIFPTQNTVRLYFGQSWPNYLGQALSLLAWLTALLCLPGVRRLSWARALRQGVNRPLESLAGALERGLSRPLGWCSRHAGALALAGLLLVAGGAGAYCALGLKADATVAFNRGLAAYNARDYGRAVELFGQAARRFPRSMILDHTLNHQALSLFLQKRYSQAEEVWRELLRRLPETALRPQTLYHLGLAEMKRDRRDQARAHWQWVLKDYPGHPYAKHAQARLKELDAPAGGGKPKDQ